MNGISRLIARQLSEALGIVDAKPSQGELTPTGEASVMGASFGSSNLANNKDPDLEGPKE